MSISQYRPDEVSHPGTTLEEVLESLNMTQADLALRSGLSKKLINEIIKGKAPITTDTALRLESVLNVPATFWNSREMKYREFLARKVQSKELNAEASWVKNFPLNAMTKVGLLPKTQNPEQALRTLLSYFSVATTGQWDQVWNEKQPAFRKSESFKCDWYSAAAWLRAGELASEAIHCDEYDSDQFRNALRAARTFTSLMPSEFKNQLQNVCRKAGVAVVYVPGLPHAPISGATQWLSPKKAVIELSNRYKSNDQFWFTFFHEAAHVLLHGKRQIFVDPDAEPLPQSADEKEANEFSAGFLIPGKEYDAFKMKRGINGHRIQEFAKQIGVDSGIVVGRLQREKVLDYSALNALKLKYREF